MFEKDLEILEKILREMKYSTSYISVLLNHLVKQLQNSKHKRFTPSFLYTHLIFDIGRMNAREIADYFEDYLKTGSYKTKIQQLLDRSPWMK